MQKLNIDTQFDAKQPFDYNWFVSGVFSGVPIGMLFAILTKSTSPLIYNMGFGFASCSVAYWLLKVYREKRRKEIPTFDFALACIAGLIWLLAIATILPFAGSRIPNQIKPFVPVMGGVIGLACGLTFVFVGLVARRIRSG